jgi:phosphoadenosine phosphosulfate reductase
MNIEKEKKAIERLKFFEPQDDYGYYLAYSGGKDSDCIKILAQLAGVKFEAVHNLTTVDAPETVRYIKSQSDVRIDRAFDSDGKPVTMWNLIVKKLMPPTRLVRYCCSELKERNGKQRVTLTGVRRAESSRRAESAGAVKIIGKPKSTQKVAEEMGAKYRINRQGGMILDDDNDESRQMVEHCYLTRRVTVNPIVDWTDDDVWEFLKHYGCRSNPLYECGFKRIGCIGCPMAGKTRYTEFERYPKYKENYIRAFDKMLEARHQRGKPCRNGATGEEVFRWWMEEDLTQITFEDFEEL